MPFHSDVYCGENFLKILLKNICAAVCICLWVPASHHNISIIVLVYIDLSVLLYVYPFFAADTYITIDTMSYSICVTCLYLKMEIFWWQKIVCVCDNKKVYVLFPCFYIFHFFVVVLFCLSKTLYKIWDLEGTGFSAGIQCVCYHIETVSTHTFWL